MQLRTWTTEALPAALRFDAWSEALDATHTEWELTERRSDFDATVTARSVGGIELVACRCDPCAGARSPLQARRADGGAVGILFTLSGSEIVRQGDREARLGPGDFVLWDSARPMEFRVLEPLVKMTIMVPRSTMRRFLPGLDAAAGLRVDGTESLGPLVGAYLRQLAAGLTELEDRHLRRVADTTLELVAAGLTARRERGTERGDLFARVTAYILDRLSDPDLAPPAIADANAISLRSLHNLFAARDESVSRWILRQRLERCRRELHHADPRRSITDIAFAWGFNDASHFSRSYRTEFGISPRASRKQEA